MKITKFRRFIKSFSAVLLSLILVFGFYVPPAGSASYTSASLTLSDSRPSNSSTTYTLTLSNVTTSAIKCMKVVFSTAASGGSVPTGFNSSSSAAFSGTSTYVPTPASWSLDRSTNGTLLVTYASGETPAGSSGRTIVFTGITNGSAADTAYYAQISTFNNTDCATSPVDSGVVAFIYTSGQSVSATVDPSLTFTIAGVSSGTVNGATVNITTDSTTVPFGTVTTSTNKIGAHALTVGTNASGGYTVTTKYTAQLTNASSDTIANHSGTNVSPSTFPLQGQKLLDIQLKILL